MSAISSESEIVTKQNLAEFYQAIYPYLGGYDKGKLTYVGEVRMFYSETAPDGFLICDGTTYNKADYPELVNKLFSLTDTTPYVVSGDDTKFKVPDLRGEFIRGSGTNSHENQGSGENVGIHQDGTTSIPIRMDANRSFVGGVAGQITIPTNYDSVIGASNYRAYNVASDTTSKKEDYLITSRPTNTSLLFCIAYKNVVIDIDFLSYGSERFSKSDMYDTNERVIGKWIDGKPLYQKTFVNTTPSVGGSKDVADVSACNIDKIISLTGMIYTNNQQVSANWSYVGSNLNSGALWYEKSQGMICQYLNSGATAYANSSENIILQYTKTTDTADSFKYSTPTDYSTEEKIVGTWIDGKPVYQKTFTLSTSKSISSTAWTSIGLEKGAVKTVLSAYGNSIYSGTGTLTLFGYLLAAVVDDEIKFMACRDASVLDVTYVTLQYTKTTD